MEKEGKEKKVEDGAGREKAGDGGRGKREKRRRRE